MTPREPICRRCGDAMDDTLTSEWGVTVHGDRGERLEYVCADCQTMEEKRGVDSLYFSRDNPWKNTITVATWGLAVVGVLTTIQVVYDTFAEGLDRGVTGAEFLTIIFVPVLVVALLVTAVGDLLQRRQAGERKRENARRTREDSEVQDMLSDYRETADADAD